MNNDKPSSESSHSPTEQPGDAKHTDDNWTIEPHSTIDKSFAIFDKHGCPFLQIEYDDVDHEEQDRRAELIARAPALLSEVSTLRSKQAELVAERDELNNAIAHVWKALGITDYTGKHISEHVSELRSERDKMREALKVSKKALYQIVDDARLKGVKYTAKAFGLVNAAYVKVESALSGGSK